MYGYKTKAIPPLNNEQIPKQQRPKITGKQGHTNRRAPMARGG
jgi:hypothetical protein